MLGRDDYADADLASRTVVLGKRGRGDLLNVVRRAREMIPADDPVLCFNWYPHVVAQLAVPQLAADRTVRWYPVGRRRHRRPAILRSPGATLGGSGRGLLLGCGETSRMSGAWLADLAACACIPNAVGFPNELGEKPGGPSWPRPYLLSVGRLSPEKDHETLLRSFALLSSQLEHDLVVAGDGPNLDRLKKIVSASGLDERVHFVGYRRDIPALMGGADLLVHTSRWEGFGCVLVEAMALGTPFVATDAPYGPRFNTWNWYRGACSCLWAMRTRLPARFSGS